MQDENQLYSFRYECTKKPTIPLLRAVWYRSSADLCFPFRAGATRATVSRGSCA
jgi:hypothetical protein